MYYQKQLSKLVFAAIIGIVSTTQAHAVGLGFSVGTGSETWSNDVGYNGDRDVSNVGFLLDTAVSRHKTFNYRFTFMKEKNTAQGSGVDLEGYATIHDFGFAVLNTREVRLWIGPELKVGYYKHLSFSNSSVDSGSATGVGVGPVIGINVNLPRVASFSVTAAYYLIGAYNGDFDYASSYATGSFDVDSSGLYLTASVLFRTNE
jgi:hypothetical protein